jgi:hypothetical protein
MFGKILHSLEFLMADIRCVVMTMVVEMRMTSNHRIINSGIIESIEMPMGRRRMLFFEKHLTIVVYGKWDVVVAGN